MEADSDEISYNKAIWPVYLLNGFNSIAFAGIIILMVPLSTLIWPGEDYRALEMGVIMTTLLWSSSISGLFFGRLIDKYSRVKVLLFISIVRSVCMILLGFAVPGQGIITWWYFLIVVLIFGMFSGGSYPAIVSLSHDIVPLKHRSKFFGNFSVAGSLFMMFGFLISGSLIQYGLWRFYFIGIGVAIIGTGVLFYLIVKEPKRGVQNIELQNVLKDDTIEYDFKMDRKTMRKTMLSRTNKAALVEGIFSNVFMGSLDMIILPYLQTPPHNLSPLVTGLFVVVFGVGGRVLGQIFLARYSDKVAEKKGIRRIYFIIISLIGGSITFVLMFFIPIPFLTREQGADIVLFFSLPVTYMMGALILCSDAVSSLYMVNQPPVLQEINLPEAQGQIVSWNQFLENIGYGMGPLIAGVFISAFGQNYQVSAMIITVFVIPGTILWILSVKWYPFDKKIIKDMLDERAKVLETRKTTQNKQP